MVARIAEDIFATLLTETEEKATMLRHLGYAMIQGGYFA